MKKEPVPDKAEAKWEYANEDSAVEAEKSFFAILEFLLSERYASPGEPEDYDGACEGYDHSLDLKPSMRPLSLEDFANNIYSDMTVFTSSDGSS